jgi:3-hydroxyacyl-CoA dehydrogenase
MGLAEAANVADKIGWDDAEILVVGAGTMGAGLAQTFAQRGFATGLIDISEEILDRARATIERELQEAVSRGIFAESQVAEIKNRIISTTSYEKACRGKNLRLALETASEDLEIKKKIFKTLDELCGPEVLLASNTSSLDVNLLANVTNRPDRVVWMHYFFPPHKNKAGEYAGTDTASPASIAKAARYMELSGKRPTPILSSRKGGAADVIFVSLLLEAARMADEGIEILSIEEAGKRAFDMPMGFLSLMDHNGLLLGFQTMRVFSDPSDPEDPLFKRYRNFFTPPKAFEQLAEKYCKTEDKSSVRWIPENLSEKEPQDWVAVDILKNRFLAVAFMTAVECVDAGVIHRDELDRLCQTAFRWKQGPFALMDRMGMGEVMRIVTERMEFSHRREINFPIPKLLIELAQKEANKETFVDE